MATQAGRRRVGAQRERLFQAAGVGAPRQGQRPAAAPGTAGKILLIQAGRQALGVPRPAAGPARVEPGPVGLAGKRGGLAVAHGRAAGMRVGEVAEARRGEEAQGTAPFQIPDHPEGRVVGQGGVIWVEAAARGRTGGARAAGYAGPLPHGAHGLIVLFRQVVVTVQVPDPGQVGQNKHQRSHTSTGTVLSCVSLWGLIKHYSASKAWTQLGQGLDLGPSSRLNRIPHCSLPPDGAADSLPISPTADLFSTSEHRRTFATCLEVCYSHLSGAEGVETEVVIFMDDR